jgi:sugar (pentulose or hexulose) kinase
MHDSSSALVPYLLHFSEPFVLLSTGTWNINLNPFNGKPLTAEELQKDCLCYLTHEAKPVKASRLFAGYEYELQVKRIASHFNQQTEKYASLVFNNETARFLKYNEEKCYALKDFAQRDLHEFENDEKAYYQLMTDLVLAQVSSTNLIMNNDVKQIFVDGGFSKNSFFMNLLANVFQDKKIFAATVAQASSLGAALVIHKHWNKKEMPSDIIELKLYPPVFSD